MVHLLDALYQEIGITNICILCSTNCSWLVAGPIYSWDCVLKDMDHWSIAKIAYIPDCSSLFHYVSVKLLFMFFWGLRWKSLKMLEIMCLCWTSVVLHTGGLWLPREPCWVIKIIFDLNTAGNCTVSKAESHPWSCSDPMGKAPLFLQFTIVLGAFNFLEGFK